MKLRSDTQHLAVVSALPTAHPVRNAGHEETRSTSEVRLYRLKQVLDRVPVSKSAWFAGIKAGRYPQGHSLGPRTTVWRSSDIDRLIEQTTAATYGKDTSLVLRRERR